MRLLYIILYYYIIKKKFLFFFMQKNECFSKSKFKKQFSNVFFIKDNKN